MDQRLELIIGTIKAMDGEELADRLKEFAEYVDKNCDAISTRSIASVFLNMAGFKNKEEGYGNE